VAEMWQKVANVPEKAPTVTNGLAKEVEQYQ